MELPRRYLNSCSATGTIRRRSSALRRAMLCSVLFMMLCANGCWNSVSGSTKVIQIEPGVMVQLLEDVTADVLIPTENGYESARVQLRAGWYCGPLPELDDNTPPPPKRDKKWYEFFAEAK